MKDWSRSVVVITLAAAAIMMVTVGMRQTLGLFVSPINGESGLGIVSISFALAVGQFVWGAIQPIAGAIADRYGPGRVIAFGLITLALGFALTPFMTTSVGLVISLGLLSAIGSGAGSFSVLIGAAAQGMAARERGKAAGVVNAGGSLGQFVFAPIAQKLISTIGWIGATWALAVMTLAALPVARELVRRDPVPHHPSDKGVWPAVKEAMKNPSYLLLHAGFFTCGFHIAFLVTHLPQEVNLCGLPPTVASWSLAIIGLANIAGSLFAGSATVRFRSKYILAWMYGSRALLIIAYLAAPKSALTFYVFAVGLGFTWLATVPPTAGIVGKLFGVRYLATLFGLTLLSHQVGGFLGAWLGGIAYDAFGNYMWVWYADIALATFAALINLPIREAAIPTAIPYTA